MRGRVKPLPPQAFLGRPQPLPFGPFFAPVSVGDRKSLSIAKNHPKTSQEFSEQFRPSTHKIKGFSKKSPQKVHPNFAENLGRRILGNTLSDPNSEIQNSEIQKIRNGSFTKSEILSETDLWDFLCRQNSGTKVRNRGFGKHFR